MVKIKSKNPSVKNCKLVVPFDGVINVDADGEAEVSANAANILVTGTNDWDFSATPIIPTEPTEDERAQAGIKAMALPELIKMATDAGIDEKDYKKFSKNQKLMAAFMIAKYNEAQLENEVEDDDEEGTDEEGKEGADEENKESTDEAAKTE